MASKASSKNRKPAGKHPTLRPKTGILAFKSNVTKQTSSPKQRSKIVPKKKANEPIPCKAATRHIITRSQSKVFRLLDLPPELRNLIYHHAASAFSANKDEPIDLKALTLPPALSPSRQVRSEALSIFFSVNHFKLRVKSNYCVFRRHFHHFEHVRYNQTGTVTLSPLLTRDLDHLTTMATFTDDEHEEEGEVALREEKIRFKHVTFEVDCVCCAPGKLIGKLELGVQGEGHAVVDCTLTVKPREGFDQAKASMELVFADVRSRVEAIGGRERFNGYTVADLIAVGACVSYEGEGEGEGRRDRHREH